MAIYDPLSEALGIEPTENPTYLEPINIEDLDLIESPSGFPHSEETKLLMSRVAKGRVFTEEHKSNIGKSKIGKSPDKSHLRGKNNPVYGRKRPEHTKRMSGENNPMSKRNREKRLVTNI